MGICGEFQYYDLTATASTRAVTRTTTAWATSSRTLATGAVLAITTTLVTIARTTTSAAVACCLSLIHI